jgi:hypothetical protein
MKPLVFTFYRLAVGAVPGAASSTEELKDRLEKLGSIKARPPVLFKRHLQHLAFFVSRHYPELEGQSLAAELEFPKENGGLRMPVLVAGHEGRALAKLPSPLSSLDMEEFQRVITKRHPGVKGEDLIFTLGMPEQEERK